MKTFRGLYPPLITPFQADGEINEQGLRDHVDFVIANGADGFCAGSSTGEFMNLTRAEWESVLGICQEQNRGRVPMLAGTADLSTRATIERARFAETVGYDGHLIIPPWYQVHTMREIEAHYRAVRAATTKPIMIYNNPPVVGVRLTLETLVQLASEDVIQYIKDADSDPYMITRLRMRLGDKLGLFYGHDNNALGAFAFGATGWVSGSGNFDPARWGRIVHLCIDEGNFTAARKLWDEIMPFVDLVTVGRHGERPDWIAVIKRGLALRGRDVGSVRRPICFGRTATGIYLRQNTAFRQADTLVSSKFRDSASHPLRGVFAGRLHHRERGVDRVAMYPRGDRGKHRCAQTGPLRRRWRDDGHTERVGTHLQQYRASGASTGGDDPSHGLPGRDSGDEDTMRLADPGDQPAHRRAVC